MRMADPQAFRSPNATLESGRRALIAHEPSYFGQRGKVDEATPVRHNLLGGCAGLTNGPFRAIWASRKFRCT